MSIHAIQPFISVITPIFNGQNTLQRAIRSVLNQSFADWEMLAIDDGSTDGSAEIIEAWANQDSRFRFFTMPENSGQCAARNLGLKHARGEFICYLDQDDEYYPDYLATVGQWRDTSEVLFFQYDLVYDDASHIPIKTWRPKLAENSIFSDEIATPLGVAHRRTLIEKVGGFNELLWTGEDGDMWRRSRNGDAASIDKMGRLVVNFDHAKTSQSRAGRAGVPRPQ